MLNYNVIETNNQAYTETQAAELLAIAWRAGYEASSGALVADNGKFRVTVWITPQREKK